jgi:molecular chaperone DnaK
MAKAVGIDLGTTNSVIAALEGGKPTVIPNTEGSRTTPSVVAFTDDGERLVGQPARRQAILNPKGTVCSARRFIGRRFDEVAQEAKTVAFDVVPAPDGVARFDIKGQAVLPGDQRADPPQAGRRRGQVPRAALAYGLDNKGHETVLAFDPSGGTFDVRILDVGDGVVEGRATPGDTHLGGDDFDRRLIDYLADEFQREQGIDLRNDPQALQAALRGRGEGQGRAELGRPRVRLFP